MSNLTDFAFHTIYNYSAKMRFGCPVLHICPDCSSRSHSDVMLTSTYDSLKFQHFDN